MTINQRLFESAKKYIPGGVNSPVRAFGSVGGTPPFIAKAKGAYVYDEENQQYIDYVGSWGPMILGHAHPAVIRAVTEAAQKGLSFGAPTAIEVDMAERICTLIPSIEQVRMVNSGTEAAMSAIRLARGFTGRDTIIKFEGGYHGHSDGLLVKSGSGLLTAGTPSSAGVPADFVKYTLVASYNDLESVEALFKQHPNRIAAVIVEPVAGNMNCIPPTADFLPGLRALCNTHNSVLIFDEVMSGFRTGLQCAQGYYQVNPDLTVLGKIIGGGMPVGAFGGRRDIMQHLAPIGNVYQAGTLSGNPVAMAAGLATLDEIAKPGFYDTLNENTTVLLKGLREKAARHKIGLATTQAGSMFGIFFSDKADITSFSDACNCNNERFKQFFHSMLTAGVYFAPSAFEAGFMSSAHSTADIEKTIATADRIFEAIANS